MPRSDLSSLSPSDGQVTLRSLPRRYRETFAGAKRRARSDVVGAGGVSALDLLYDTVASLSLLERALDQIDTANQPALHAGVLDPAERDFGAPGAQAAPRSDSVDDALADLEAVANSFADRVATVSGDAWSRTGTVVARGSGNGTSRAVTALEVLQEAAATATDNLRAADRLLSGT